MSLLVTAGLLVVSIILLIITFVFATDALWQLGISNLFKTIEEVFDGKNKGETATDYLIYAMIISGTLLGIFVLLIVVAIILVIVGGVALGAGAATGVDEGALAVAGVAEGGEAAAAAGEAAVEAGEAAEAGGEAAASEGSSFLSEIGNLLNSWVGTVLMIVLVIVIFTSSASGAFCFLAAVEIRKEPKYDGDSKLKNAYEDAVIAGISGIAVAVFSIMAIIGYYSYKYYRKQKLLKAEKLLEQAKQQKLKDEAKGLVKLEEIKAGEREGGNK